MPFFRSYILNILVSFDQFVNTIFLGDPDETISSRSAKAKNRGIFWGCILCKFLDFFQKDHCDIVIEPDEGKKQITNE